MGDKTCPSIPRGHEGVLQLSLQGDKRSDRPVEKQLLKFGCRCKNTK